MKLRPVVVPQCPSRRGLMCSRSRGLSSSGFTHAAGRAGEQIQRALARVAPVAALVRAGARIRGCEQKLAGQRRERKLAGHPASRRAQPRNGAHCGLVARRPTLRGSRAVPTGLVAGGHAPTARITPSPLYLRINATSLFKSSTGGVGFVYAEAEG